MTAFSRVIRPGESSTLVPPGPGPGGWRSSRTSRKRKRGGSECGRGTGRRLFSSRSGFRPRTPSACSRFRISCRTCFPSSREEDTNADTSFPFSSPGSKPKRASRDGLVWMIAPSWSRRKKLSIHAFLNRSDPVVWRGIVGITFRCRIFPHKKTGSTLCATG